MNAHEAKMPGLSGVEAYERRIREEEKRHTEILHRMAHLCADVQQTINMIEANVASQKVEIVSPDIRLNGRHT